MIKRVRIENYKSIGRCDVELQPLTFLAGLNGAGKSNFLDGLRFVADALRSSLDHAMRERGGLNEVRRRSSGHPNHFGIRLDYELSDGSYGHYSFKVGARPHGAYAIQAEECFRTERSNNRQHYFMVGGEELRSTSVQIPPAFVEDRLFLVNIGSLPEFRPVFDALSRMGFYNLSPERIRSLQPPDSGELLLRDGSNIASVYSQLSRRRDGTQEKIESYLAKVTPGIEGVTHRSLAPMETVEFRQKVAGAKSAWRFPALNMSDGTLRAFGVLVSLFQTDSATAGVNRLVGIEEPEAALHPAAAGVLFDCLTDASERSQVLVTSHSPDLLNHKDLDVNSILAVISEDGETQIAPVDEEARQVLREHLATAGELLRVDRLQPDRTRLDAIKKQQLRLFEEEPK